MKRALVVRDVASHDVPLDAFDNACVQVLTSFDFVTEVACASEQEIRDQLLQPPSRGSSSSSFTNSHTQQQQQQYQYTNGSYNSLQSRTTTTPFDAVLLRASGLAPQRLAQILQLIRTISKQIFVCVFSAQLITHPMGRYQCFQDGASMVTGSFDDVRRVMKFIASCGSSSNRSISTTDMASAQRPSFSSSSSSSSSRASSTYTCPFCAKPGLTEDQLWRHCPLFHINAIHTDGIVCPICRTTTRGPFQVHLHNGHGPPGRGEMTSEFAMADATLYAFALVVCFNRRTQSFLLVQEFANSGYWLPGGRVDCGESPLDAAIRETKEEAGIDIRVTGILKIEYHPKRHERSSSSSSSRSSNSYVRMRFVFLAEPLDDEQLPKSIPDYESVGATWCGVRENVAALPLRGPEPVEYFAHVVAGKPVYPLELLHATSAASSFVNNGGSLSNGSSRRQR